MKSNKKYEFTGETKVHFGVTLRQIRALRDFGAIRAGEIGGWIEEERNLSHEGGGWVFGNGEVFGNGKVFGNGEVFGNGKVFGNGEVSGNGWVFGNGEVFGNGKVFGNGEVSGNGWVSGNGDILCISPIGSESGTLVAHRDKKIGLRVTRGCFSGSVAEFEGAVAERHGDNEHGRVYEAAIHFVKAYFATHESAKDRVA